LSRFTSTKVINTRWRNNDFVGAAGSTHTFPDAFHEEFLVDWALQISDGSVVITETPTTGVIQMSSLTVGDITLTGTATGFPGAPTIIGTSPISVATAAGTSTVSLNASYSTTSHLHDGTYQPFGTYITSITGAAPITASGTTAITVGIDQSAITGATAATNAQVVRFFVKNTTGTTIPKGSAVYVSGATGDNALISLASATSEASSSKTLGITAEAIATDAFGYVIEAGYLTDIDTSATTAGAAVWLGNTPGSLVFVTPPAEPSHAVYLGVVVRVQSNNGSILVKVQNGYELDELHDVSAASPSDGDIIQYKTSSSLWTKSSIASAGIAASVHTHPYQAAGTYVTAVNGTAPITASTDTAGVVTVGLSASYASDVHTHATSSITSGNFVATLAAGTGVTVTGADANAAAKTVSIGQAVATSSNVTFNDLNINGDNSLWICRATRASGTQSLTNNSDTKVALDTASSTATTNSYDPHSWFSDADDNIVIGQAGVYNITATVGFAANATSRRSLTILVNSAAVAATQVPASPANETSLSISTNIYLDVGDTVHMNTRQNSGGALNTSTLAGAYPVLSVARVGA
jgi:phage gp46-like protein